MATYLEKAIHLNPGLQHVVFWKDRCPQADFEDPYDRLLWNHPTLPKPSKATLDAVLDSEVDAAKLASLKSDAKAHLQADPYLKTLFLMVRELKMAQAGMTQAQANTYILNILDGLIT